MAGIGSPPDSLKNRPGKPFLSRLVGVFVEPGETFEEIARNPGWLAPLVLLVLVALVFVATLLLKVGAREIVLHGLQQSGRAAGMDPAQLDHIAQTSAPVVRFLMPAAAAFWTPIFMLAVAGFGLLVLNGFFGQHAKFRDIFSVSCYAYLPSIVGVAMAMAVVLFGDPSAFNPQCPAPTNPGYFMNPLTSSRPVMALASSLDVIILWYLVLLAIGLSRVVRKRVKFGTLFSIYLGAWALVVIVKVGFAMLFAGH